MRNRCALVLAVATLSAVVLTPSNASAATEIGNVCTGTDSGGPNTWAQLANQSSGLPVAVPATGVLTQWRLDSGFSVSVMEQLKIMRPSGNPNELRVVEEEPAQTMNEGENVYAARIPVQAGDLLGLYSKQAVPLCAGAKTGDVAGFYSGDLLTTDAAYLFGEDKQNRIPVSAFIEPDADGDGFGDETQDKCPQSAQFQTECPRIELEQFAVAGKGSLTDVVIANHEAPVTVTATAKAPGGKHKVHPATSIALKGGTRTLAPGKLVKFKLKFTKPLKSALEALPKGRSLALTIKASATNLVGQVSSETTALKLKR